MHRKNRPANWTGRLRQGLSHGKSAMDAMRCPGSIRGMLTGYGFRKSCCSKRRSLRSFLITSAFWGCFRMCLLWRTRRWMRSCSAGVASDIILRARNLHKCAKMVVDEYSGSFSIRSRFAGALARYRSIDGCRDCGFFVRRQGGHSGRQCRQGVFTGFRCGRSGVGSARKETFLANGSRFAAGFWISKVIRKV